MTAQPPGSPLATAGPRRRAESPASVLARLGAATRRVDGAAPVAPGTRVSALWVVVIALDFFWISNPELLFSFPYSLHSALGVTMAALLLSPRPRRPALPWSVVGVVAFGGLSCLWSVYTRLSIDHALIYLCLAAAALAVVTTVDARTVAAGMVAGGVLVVVASAYIYAIELPGSLPAPGEGVIAGVAGNRNILSYTVVLALPFALAGLPASWPGRAAWAGGLGILVTGLALSESATGAVTAVLLAGAALTLAGLDRLGLGTRTRPSRAARLVLPLTLLVAVGVLALLLSLTGRDALTLTGRTPIWEATWSSLDGWVRWVGTGFGTVWPHPWHGAPPNDLYTAIVVANGGIALTHGHNSLFDLLPEVGIVGAALYATVYAQAVLRALAMRRSAIDGEWLHAARLVLLGILALLVYGITEPMSTIPLGWFVAVAVTAVLPRRRPAVTPED